MRTRILLFSALLLINIHWADSQILKSIFQGSDKALPAITGNSGLIMIPTARFPADKEIMFVFATNPEKYHILPFKDSLHKTAEKLYSVTMAFLPFLEITGTVTRPDNIAQKYSDSVDTRWGIGDRSIKMRILLLNEHKYLPAMVIGLHDFFSTNFHQSAAYLVMSKKIEHFGPADIDFHLGYGFDVSRKPFTSTSLFSNHGQIPGKFLTGIFGGFTAYYKFTRINIEYDTHKFNAGWAVMLFNRLGIQLSTLGFDRLSLTASFRYPLGKPLIPKKKSS
ncbi:MAG: YjbH domain-containing protein [Bacteroidia bacterium]|nr:YjbH domain-containing protein [Bacteroidia bacterium]